MAAIPCSGPGCKRTISISIAPGGNPVALADPENWATEYLLCRGCGTGFCDRCLKKIGNRVKCNNCGGQLYTPDMRDKIGIQFGTEPAGAPKTAAQPVTKESVITIACPGSACSAKFRINESWVGKKARCQKCGAKFRIERSDNESVACKAEQAPGGQVLSSTGQDARRGQTSVPADAVALLADQFLGEFVEAVTRVKQAACAAIGVPLKKGGDPRSAVTSTGISLLYTIGRVGGSFRHGFSLSSQWNPLSTAGGRLLCVAVAALLGRDLRGAVVEVGRSGVCYVQFDLDAQAQAEFARHVVTAPFGQAASFREKCVELAERVRIQVTK